MEGISRRQALGGFAMALAGAAFGRVAIAAEPAPASAAADEALDATVTIGDLTVSYPNSWTRTDGEDGAVTLQAPAGASFFLQPATELALDTTDEKQVAEALAAHFDAMNAADGIELGDIARTVEAGVVRASTPYVATSDILNACGFYYVIFANGAAYSMATLCESAHINDYFGTFQKIWKSATIAGAAAQEAPASAEETAPAASEAPAAAAEPTMGQRNALSKAQSYLKFTAFSHSGLVEQLEFEGFSTEDATWAADNCGADWNAQAAAKAQSYLDFTSFSRDGLIEQLEFEGFTPEQAEYGVTAVGY